MYLLQVNEDLNDIRRRRCFHRLYHRGLQNFDHRGNCKSSFVGEETLGVFRRRRLNDEVDDEGDVAVVVVETMVVGNQLSLPNLLLGYHRIEGQRLHNMMQS